MLHSQTWGTHLEVTAAAFFQVPVYYTRTLHKLIQMGVERATIYQSLGFDFPEVVNAPPHDQCPITHFELAYMMNPHYDSIITTITERPSQEHPHIPMNMIDMTYMVL